MHPLVAIHGVAVALAGAPAHPAPAAPDLIAGHVRAWWAGQPAQRTPDELQAVLAPGRATMDRVLREMMAMDTKLIRGYERSTADPDARIARLERSARPEDRERSKLEIEMRAKVNEAAESLRSLRTESRRLLDQPPQPEDPAGGWRRPEWRRSTPAGDPPPRRTPRRGGRT